MKKLIALTMSAALLFAQTAFAQPIYGIGIVKNCSGSTYRCENLQSYTGTNCGNQLLNRLFGSVCGNLNFSCGRTVCSPRNNVCEKTTEATTKAEPTTKAPVRPNITTEATTKAPERPNRTTEPPTETTTRRPQTTTERVTERVTEKHTETTTQAQPSKNQTQNTMAIQVLNLVNKERAAKGLSALTLDSALTNAATLKAQDMADKNYFDHTSPTYGTPFQMLKSLGISYRSAGENIAKGQRSATEVMNAWMNSSGHRANILGSSYGKLGVGYVVKNGTTYWVQIFTN